MQKRHRIWTPYNSEENCSEYMERKRWVYLGIDESNHGKFPEIIVGVFSDFRLDVLGSRLMYPKVRNGRKQFFKKMAKRKYSFLMMSKAEKKEMIPDSYWGVVASSLVFGEKIGESIDVYIDGDVQRKKMDCCREYLTSVTGLPRYRVQVHCGADLDRRLPLVNMADQIAHWIFRNQPLEKIVNDGRKKQILDF